MLRIRALVVELGGGGGGGSILNLNPVANEECTERQLRITPPPLTRFPPEPLQRINKCKVR